MIDPIIVTLYLATGYLLTDYFEKRKKIWEILGYEDFYVIGVARVLLTLLWLPIFALKFVAATFVFLIWVIVLLLEIAILLVTGNKCDF